jgi:hypothetical protein
LSSPFSSTLYDADLFSSPPLLLIYCLSAGVYYDSYSDRMHSHAVEVLSLWMVVLWAESWRLNRPLNCISQAYKRVGSFGKEHAWSPWTVPCVEEEISQHIWKNKGVITDETVLNCQLWQWAVRECVTAKQIFYCDEIQNVMDNLIECRVITLRLCITNACLFRKTCKCL